MLFFFATSPARNSSIKFPLASANYLPVKSQRFQILRGKNAAEHTDKC